MKQRTVRITIEIDGKTNLDDATLEQRLETLVDPEQLLEQALEEGELIEFEETTFRFSEPGDVGELDGSRQLPRLFRRLKMPAVQVSDDEFRKAPNLEAILAWVDARRPDVSGHVREIMTLAWARDAVGGEALLFLLTVGFAAGRQYQHQHPGVSPEGYHRIG